jgi:4-hydroxy-2-oxoheptanedioate aldolase
MACRYPFPRSGITVRDTDEPLTSGSPTTGSTLAYRGLRGASAPFAAEIWGVTLDTYNHIADLWPLNPKGEIAFGVKIEDTFADQNAAQTIGLPGIAFAEWGPGDHSYWLYGLSIMPEDGSRIPDLVSRPEMVKVRQNVLDICKKNHVMFLNAGNTDSNSPTYVIKQIQEGTMVMEAGEEAAIIGREYTKRKMPV